VPAPVLLLVLMRDALRGLLAGRIMALLGLCMVCPLGEVGGEVAMAGAAASETGAAGDLFRAEGRDIVGGGPGQGEGVRLRIDFDLRGFPVEELGGWGRMGNHSRLWESRRADARGCDVLAGVGERRGCC
jgi:hypothetical protein